VARIDFGHAFNDLIATSEMFGGQPQNKNNSILDFFNRSAVANFPISAQTKLWRDYEATLIQSDEMVEALKNIGSDKNRNKIYDSLDKVKQSFIDLYDQNTKASVVGIFLDGSTQTIRDIKVSNTWIGGSAGAGSFGIKAIGGVSDLGLMGVRVEGMGTCFSGDGSPGYMIATNITGLSCFNSTTTDLSLGNIGGSISGSYFTATTPVTDTTNNSMTVVGNSFTSLPRHQGATSHFLFNYGDTSAELQISGSASTSVTPLVNYVKITGSPTGGLSAISAAGTDTNIPLGFFAKNAADVIFYTNNNAAQFVVQNNISATNFVSVTGSTGSNPVVIRPNNGSGNASMQFQAAGTGTLSSNKPIVTLSTTVSSLGTCSASNDGASWGVTDSTVSLFGATLVGGGANHVPAYCNGTNWVVR
jgi:hypothetical protein